VRELTQVLRNIRYSGTNLSDEDALQAELDELSDRLFSRAAELVEKLAKTITGLGGNLASRVEAQGTVVTLEAVYLEDLPGVQQIVPVTI